jgi:hypothetical protein
MYNIVSNLEVFAMDKHSSLLFLFASYEVKTFYCVGTLTLGLATLRTAPRARDTSSEAVPIQMA